MVKKPRSIHCYQNTVVNIQLSKYSGQKTVIKNNSKKQWSKYSGKNSSQNMGDKISGKKRGQNTLFYFQLSKYSDQIQWSSAKKST